MVNESKDFPEVKETIQNQRKHVRVDDVLKLDYRKISQQDYNECKTKPEIIFKKTFGEAFEAPKIEDVSLELLYKLIYHANLKIDRILNILESKDTERPESVSSETINISGSGMKFIANRSFSIGDIIILRVFLPLISKTWINILGKVVSATKSETENKYDVTIKFKQLSETDREIIIRYVFKRQRELIRHNSDVKNREI
ncbi:MAG: PilZ domain-containing protein [Deltaproteobacteria bacterium]|nr:PilZ domain-containing protein [Deltaproteobacteria bacterium]MBW2661353.1 PilZ domain-containing protein [Deltaproteobacteria bacterium]